MEEQRLCIGNNLLQMHMQTRFLSGFRTVMCDMIDRGTVDSGVVRIPVRQFPEGNESVC